MPADAPAGRTTDPFRPRRPRRPARSEPRPRRRGLRPLALGDRLRRWSRRSRSRRRSSFRDSPVDAGHGRDPRRGRPAGPDRPRPGRDGPAPRRGRGRGPSRSTTSTRMAAARFEEQLRDSFERARRRGRSGPPARRVTPELRDAFTLPIGDEALSAAGSRAGLLQGARGPVRRDRPRPLPDRRRGPPRPSARGARPGARGARQLVGPRDAAARGRRGRVRQRGQVGRGRAPGSTSAVLGARADRGRGVPGGRPCGRT